MNKIFKNIAVLVMCFLTLITVFGCKFTVDNDKLDDVKKEEEEKNEEIDPNKTHIYVGVLPDTSERALMRKWKTAYEAIHTDIQILLENMDSNYNQGMAKYIQAKNMPDIVWTAGDQHSSFSSEGAFVDLSAYFTKDGVKTSDYYDEIMATIHYSSTDTGIWFVPRDYNKLTVYYNKDMFDAAKIAYPTNSWTWSDLETICAKFRAKMDADYNIDAGLAKISYPIDFNLAWGPNSYTMLSNFGGKVYDENGNSVINSLETKNYLNYLYDFTFNKRYAMKSNEWSSNFMNGNAAMCVEVRPKLATLTGAPFDIDVVSFPNRKQADGSDGYVGVGCSGYALSNQSTQKDLAWNFLKFIISEEGQNVGGETGLIVPSLKSMAASGKWTEFKFGTHTLNYTAFTQTNANDLFLNYYNCKAPEDHFDITNAMMRMSLTTSFDTFHAGTAISDYIKLLQNINK